MIAKEYDVAKDFKYKSKAWKQKMAVLGSALQNKNVQHIYFVHGTFAGEDPLGLNSLVGNLSIAENSRFFNVNALNYFTNKVLDHLAKDLGNYTNDYVETFDAAIPEELTCTAFI